jgi:DNA-binding NarL/FixJ family response regulator
LALTEQAQLEKLTPQQRQIVSLLFDFSSYGNIAEITGCAEQTVKIHVKAICRRWGIDTRRYRGRGRIIYLEAIRRGLIRNEIVSKASYWRSVSRG